MSQSQVIVRRKGEPEFSDELKHWKYIKKKKVNGKWRYYYDDSELSKFDRGATVTTEKINKYGTKVTKTTKYEQTDDLFDKGNQSTRVTGNLGSSSFDNTETIKYQGKLSRSIAKGEKYIYDKFLSGKNKSKTLSKAKKSINKGKKKLAKLLGIH